MRRIFQNVNKNAVINSTDKELRGHSLNVGGLHVTIENKIAEGKQYYASAMI